MLAQAKTAVLSPLSFLLSAGGLPLLAFGIVLSLWGLWNIFRTQNSVPILAQLTLSLLPGMIAIVASYLACADFTEMATAETAPKPATFAAAAGRAMSYGFFGLLSTVIPVLLGTVAIRNHCARLRSVSSDAAF